MCIRSTLSVDSGVGPPFLPPSLLPQGHSVRGRRYLQGLVANKVGHQLSLYSGDAPVRGERSI